MVGAWLIVLGCHKLPAEQGRIWNDLVPCSIVPCIWLDAHTPSGCKLVVHATASRLEAAQECKLLLHGRSTQRAIWCNTTRCFEEQAELTVAPG